MKNLFTLPAFDDSKLFIWQGSPSATPEPVDFSPEMENKIHNADLLINKENTVNQFEALLNTEGLNSEQREKFFNEVQLAFTFGIAKVLGVKNYKKTLESDIQAVLSANKVLNENPITSEELLAVSEKIIDTLIDEDTIFGYEWNEESVFKVDYKGNLEIERNMEVLDLTIYTKEKLAELNPNIKMEDLAEYLNAHKYIIKQHVNKKVESDTLKSGLNLSTKHTTKTKNNNEAPTNKKVESGIQLLGGDLDKSGDRFMLGDHDMKIQPGATKTSALISTYCGKNNDKAISVTIKNTNEFWTADDTLIGTKKEDVIEYLDAQKALIEKAETSTEAIALPTTATKTEIKHKWVKDQISGFSLDGVGITDKEIIEGKVPTKAECIKILDLYETTSMDKNRKSPSDFALPLVAIQAGLTHLGYKPGKIDGIYKSSTHNKTNPSNTMKAIMEFQKTAGIKEDGIPGPITIKHLMAALNSGVPVNIAKNEEADTPVKTRQTSANKTDEPFIGPLTKEASTKQESKPFQYTSPFSEEKTEPEEPVNAPGIDLPPIDGDEIDGVFVPNKSKSEVKKTNSIENTDNEIRKTTLKKAIKKSEKLQKDLQTKLDEDAFKDYPETKEQVSTLIGMIEEGITSLEDPNKQLSEAEITMMNEVLESKDMDNIDIFIDEMKKNEKQKSLDNTPEKDNAYVEGKVTIKGDKSSGNYTEKFEGKTKGIENGDNKLSEGDLYKENAKDTTTSFSALTLDKSFNGTLTAQKRAQTVTALKRILTDIIAKSSPTDWNNLVDKDPNSGAYKRLLAVIPNNKPLLDKWIVDNLKEIKEN